jgi:hypothetical protein
MKRQHHINASSTSITGSFPSPFRYLLVCDEMVVSSCNLACYFRWPMMIVSRHPRLHSCDRDKQGADDDAICDLFHPPTYLPTQPQAGP